MWNSGYNMKKNKDVKNISLLIIIILSFVSVVPILSSNMSYSSKETGMQSLDSQMYEINENFDTLELTNIVNFNPISQQRVVDSNSTYRYTIVIDRITIWISR